MYRSAESAEFLSQHIHIHIGIELIPVHLLRRRMENEIYTVLLTELRIMFQISRIACKILRRSKLHRIDKNTHNDSVILSGCIDQTHMSLMQVAHGRHKTDRKSFLFPLLHLCSYFFYG